MRLLVTWLLAFISQPIDVADGDGLLVATSITPETW